MIPDITNRLTPEQKYLLNRLTKPRSGWIRRGIPENIAETVQQHTEKVIYATSLFATIERGFDADAALQYAIGHDFPEIIAPDYTPHDKITPEEKHRQERAALTQIVAPYGEEGQRIFANWLAYEAQATPTSRIVFQLDKIDAGIQAIEYSKIGFKVDDFIPYTEKKIVDPRLQRIFSQVVAKRNEQNAYETYFSLLQVN